MSVARITDATGPELPELRARLDAWVSEGAFPGAQACVVHRGAVVHRSAHGRAALDGPAVTLSTLFDVASVTKAVGTTALALVLVGDGTVGLDDPVVRFLPEFGRGGKRAVTVRHLLGHASGLPAWKPLFSLAQEDATARAIYPGLARADVPRFRAFERARHLVRTATLEHALDREPGQACVYSDLGFVALGECLAAAGGASLDRLVDQHVLAPLGLSDTSFFDHASPRGPRLPAGRAFAATGLTRPREPAPGQEGLFSIPPQEPASRDGEVDDDNAYAMAGVAGHAGLFSTADDVALFGARLLEEEAGARRLAPAETLATFLEPRRLAEGPARALGYDLPAAEGSAAGTKLGRAGPKGAFGHLGFTGCSLWVDRDRELSVALLTNRVHPTRANVEPIRLARPAFHDLVATLVDGGSP